MRPILALYVNAGWGSRAIAQALKTSLGERGCKVTLMPLHSLLPPSIDRLLFGRYRSWCGPQSNWLLVLTGMRWFYPMLYLVLPLLMRSARTKKQECATQQILMQHQGVICCSFYCAFFANYYARRFRLLLKTAGVLGDYGISGAWRTSVDALFVSHPYTHPVLRWHTRLGTPIYPLGVPTRYRQPQSQPQPKPKSISTATSRQQPHNVAEEGASTSTIRQIQPRTVDVLICGGGWGITARFDVFSTIDQLAEVTRIIVVCGTNAQLRAQLQLRFKSQIDQGRMVVLGTVCDMTSRYLDAQIIVGKAGGLTLTEAAILGRPFVVTASLPGQETQNVRVFKGAGAVWQAKTPQQLVRCIASIATTPGLAQQRVCAAKRLTNISAAGDIADRLIALFR